ncbi:uncharacterized protein N7484_012014 [Penicillium longicatenatum]|uniref:uncharacterized protein n=1 Tax=Penicillium longicatenatum TaxID=1561947 RepID=UPI002548042C|nr:uncharacterized protein N7484_012014 [Penicillium longicatenatum]KAJ5631914.1 hypothetical protein N7484_012014 [Penicillium longicatenatum]
MLNGSSGLESYGTVYFTSVAERYNLTGRARVWTLGAMEKLDLFEGCSEEGFDPRLVPLEPRA